MLQKSLSSAAPDPLHPGAGHGLIVHFPGLPGHRLLHVAGEWVSEVSVGQDRDNLALFPGRGQGRQKKKGETTRAMGVGVGDRRLPS